MRYLFLVFFLVVAQIIHAQNNGSIKGLVVDAEGQPLQQATISVISAQDSIVLSYVLSNAKGQFDLVRLPVQKDLSLFISHISSADYERSIRLEANEKLDIGQVMMEGLSLEEVVITRSPPIRFNGDTLEYKADYFKTRPNATVEELLQLLPGLQVNADGTIFYEGREVSGVRVNGKDFFIEDITIATKNLDASLIDIVQVIKDRGDSKLEIMDDTDLPIILNLKTKKDFVRADFGKFYGSGGTRDRYEAGALLNTFRDTLQVSFIGYANNVGRKGFDYSELSQYGGMDRAENNDQSYMYWAGLQNSISTGINVNYDIDTRLKTNFMYNFEQQDVYMDSQSETDSYYGDIVENAKNLYENNYRYRDHSLRGLVRYVPDTTFRISLELRANLVSNRDESNSSRNQLRDQLTPVIDGTTSSIVTSTRPYYSHNFQVEKKIHPKLIFNLRHNFSSSYSERYQTTDSYNRFYLFQDSIVDETVRRGTDETSVRIDNRLAVEWRHHKNLLTEYYVGYNRRNTNELIDIQRRVNADEFVNRNDVANEKKSIEDQFLVGAKLKATIWEKLKAELGASMMDLSRNYHFYGRSNDGTYSDRYFLPFATLSYGKLNLQYNKQVSSPSLFYFQVVNTADFYPTNEVLASTYFDNEISDSYSARFNTKLKHAKVDLSLYARYSKRSNAIGSEMVYNVDNSYSTRRNYQTGSIDNYSFSVSASRVFLQNKDWRLNWSTSAYGNAWGRLGKINGMENEYTNVWGSLRNSMTLTYKTKVTFTPSYNLNIDVIRNKVQNDFFRDVSEISHEVGGTLLLSDIQKFRLETSYVLRNQTYNLNNDRENLNLINASLYYPVFGKGELKFTAFDILNQNRSSYIYGNGNSNTFSNHLTLHQYFMVGLVYKFLAAGEK
jgi:hypothetical protein